jgi:hypothetical protein
MRQIMARPAAIATPPRRRKTPASLASPGSFDTTIVAIEITPITANVIASPAPTTRSVLTHGSRSEPASQVASAATSTTGASTTRFGGSIRKLSTSMR